MSIKSKFVMTVVLGDDEPSLIPWTRIRRIYRAATGELSALLVDDVTTVNVIDPRLQLLWQKLDHDRAELDRFKSYQRQ